MWAGDARRDCLRARPVAQSQIRGYLMRFPAPPASVVLLTSFVQFSSGFGAAQALTPLCQPSVTGPIVVASPEQRLKAGRKAQPPLTDTYNGFAWPDTPIGIIKP